MAGPMAVDGPAADPMAVDEQPYAAGGESARNQELLAKIAAIEEKAAVDAKTIDDLNAEKKTLLETNAANTENIAIIAAAIAAGREALNTTNTKLIADNEALTKWRAEAETTIANLTAARDALMTRLVAANETITRIEAENNTLKIAAAAKDKTIADFAPQLQSVTEERGHH